MHASPSLRGGVTPPLTLARLVELRERSDRDGSPAPGRVRELSHRVPPPFLWAMGRKTGRGGSADDVVVERGGKRSRRDASPGRAAVATSGGESACGQRGGAAVAGRGVVEGVGLGGAVVASDAAAATGAKRTRKPSAKAKVRGALGRAVSVPGHLLSLRLSPVPRAPPRRDHRLSRRRPSGPRPSPSRSPSPRRRPSRSRRPRRSPRPRRGPRPPARQASVRAGRPRRTRRRPRRPRSRRRRPRSRRGRRPGRPRSGKRKRTRPPRRTSRRSSAS